MSPRLTLVTAGRVLRQIRHDPRTIGLLVVVPCVLLGLLAWIYQNTPVFDALGAPLLGVFPFVVMFLVTSIATLRERRSGTLERLLTLPLGKGDLLGGYAVAFGALAAVQAVVATAFSVWVLGLDVAGSTWALLLCGLLVPRDQLPDVLYAISAVLPLSYAVDAMRTITTDASGGADVARDVLVVLAFAVAALAAGSATLRRRTA
jgi:ABC-2 type transport system permease protein